MKQYHQIPRRTTPTYNTNSCFSSYYGVLVMFILVELMITPTTAATTTTTTMMMMMMMKTLIVEAQTHEQITTTLRDRWSLPDSPTSFEYWSDDDGWNFIMEYPVSNEVADTENDSTLQIHLYDKGCRYNDGNIPIELLLVDNETSSSSSSSSSVPIIKTDVTFVPSSATNDNETLFSARLDLKMSSSTSSSTASLLEVYPSLYDSEQQEIQFCVRVSLLKSEIIEVNFVESLVKMNMVLDGTFVIQSAVVDAKERIQKSGKLVYGVVAYLCNDQYLPIRRSDQNKRSCDPNKNTDADPTFTITTRTTDDDDDDDDTDGVIISAPALMYKVCNSNNGINNKNNEDGDAEKRNPTSSISSSSSTTSSTSSAATATASAAAASVEKLAFPQGSIIRICVHADDCSMGQVEIKN